MTDQQGPTNTPAWQPTDAAPSGWAPPTTPPAPPAWNPSAAPGAQTQSPGTGSIPPPPQAQAAQMPPPPTAGFNPTPAVRYRPGLFGRGRGRGGVYPLFAGIISLLVTIVTAAFGNGHFSFVILLPILGGVYGVMNIVTGRGRVLGIIGVVLCALALLLDAALLLI